MPTGYYLDTYAGDEITEEKRKISVEKSILEDFQYFKVISTKGKIGRKEHEMVGMEKTN